MTIHIAQGNAGCEVETVVRHQRISKEPYETKGEIANFTRSANAFFPKRS